MKIFHGKISFFVLPLFSSSPLQNFLQNTLFFNFLFVQLKFFILTNCRVSYRFSEKATDLEVTEMEKADKNQRACKLPEADLFLKWGNKKRLRCVRVRERDPEVSPYGGGGGRIRRKISSRFLTFSDKDTPFLYPSNRLTRNSEAAMLRSENRKFRAASPEKVAGDNGGGGEENRGAVWPKIYITLSTKEREEDFMAMKGCKLPHRPKKRAKIIQRTLLLLSPGAWLTDMCQERYEVREKKTTKKRPRGLKAMGSLESDSE